MSTLGFLIWWSLIIIVAASWTALLVSRFEQRSREAGLALRAKLWRADAMDRLTGRLAAARARW